MFAFSSSTSSPADLHNYYYNYFYKEVQFSKYTFLVCNHYSALRGKPTWLEDKNSSWWKICVPGLYPYLVDWTVWMCLGTFSKQLVTVFWCSSILCFIGVSGAMFQKVEQCMVGVKRSEGNSEEYVSFDSFPWFVNEEGKQWVNKGWLIYQYQCYTKVGILKVKRLKDIPFSLNTPITKLIYIYIYILISLFWFLMRVN